MAEPDLIMALPAKLISEIAAVLRAYEAWEADLILNADWRNETPRLTQAQYGRLMEIQAMRNATLGKADGGADA